MPFPCFQPILSRDANFADLGFVYRSLLLLGSVLLVLFWLHLRRKKIEKLEDASDPFELAAYGIEPPVAQKQRRRDRLRAIMAR